MRRNNDPTQARLLNLLLVLLLAILIVGGLLAINYWERSREKPSEGLERQIEFEGKTYTLRRELETTLFIGVDAFSSDINPEAYLNGQQADFLLLIVRDRVTGKCSAIQINRDTMTHVRVLGVGGRVVDVREQQIALSHAYGTGSHDSCLNTVRAVSELLEGVKVDHYVALTMDAVPALNDFVGGVEVTLEEDFSFADPMMTAGTTLTLTGEQALTFVRARGGLEEPTNLRRMERQQVYLTALWKKVSEKVDEGVKWEDVEDLLTDVVTDYSASQMRILAERLGSLEMDVIAQIEGEATVGSEFMEFRPDEDALRKLIVDTFYSER